MQEEARAWWKEAVIYQIYPRSFADSNGDGIGDLQGITDHLEYLQDLGVGVIWLSPIYASPNDDNGYDISDYYSILPEFGTMADFDALLEKAHRLGIRVVMDLVVNHTSDEHPWFIESRSDPASDKRDYYIWRDGKDGGSPNNWGSRFGGSAWELDRASGQYYLHCYSRKMPDLNWANPAVRKSVYRMMDWWCRKGIDGFRMDVISMISKPSGFPDGEVTDGLYGNLLPLVANGAHVHEYLQEMNREVLSHYDLLTVGETLGVTIPEAKKYAGYERGELNMVFQFDHVSTTVSSIGKWTTEKPKMTAVRDILFRWQRELDGVAWNSVFLSSHDEPRCVSHYGNDAPEYRVRSAKMLATALHFLKGSIYIYQGEELGMTNAGFSDISDYRDIESIRAYHQYVDSGLISPKEMMQCIQEISRENSRTPMQWDASPNAGFTAGTSWIGINPNYTEINAEAERADPESVFHYYKKLIRLRKEFPVIVYGAFTPLLEESKSIFAYRRTLAGEELTVACNWTSETVPCHLFQSEEEDLISNYPSHCPNCLQPYEARAVLRKK